MSGFANSPKPEYSPDGRPPEHLQRRRLSIRFIAAMFLLVGIIGLGLNIFVWVNNDTQNVFKEAGGIIEGFVENDETTPLTDVTIFTNELPENSALTDENGHFYLENVPTGEQILILSRNEIEQEFAVRIKINEITNVGILTYQPSPGTD